MAELYDCSGLILAGGRSSRMGSPKAWLEFRGEPMLTRIVGRLTRELPEVVVVRARGQELPPVIARIVEDRVDGEGPVAGLAAGLAAVSQPLVFALSCDMPFANLAVARGLLELVEEYDAVLPRWNGRLHPLHAVYRATLVPLLDEQLAAGRRRLMDLFDRIRTRVVTEEELRAWDPDGSSFVNINTREEYERALAMGVE